MRIKKQIKKIKLSKELSDKYVLDEIKKLQYLYNLNKVVRYSLERNEKHQTQSVAEHLINMICLAYYFRELEDPEGKMDFEKVIKIILCHDLGEIETGDTITTLKNKNHERKEREAIKRVKKQTPNFIANDLQKLYEEYEEQKTKEGQFVKAVDKLEGQMFWMDEEGVKMVKHVLKKNNQKLEVEQPKLFKKIHTLLTTYNFPYMLRFLEVIDKEKRRLRLYS